MIRAAVYDAILSSPENRFSKYVSKETRTTDKPITVFTLRKSIFANFVVSPPLKEDLEIVDVWRDNERKNVVNFSTFWRKKPLTVDGTQNLTKRSIEKLKESIELGVFEHGQKCSEI